MYQIIALIGVALSLSACSMTPTQKKWVGFAAGVVAVGALAAHNDGGKAASEPKSHLPPLNCQASPESCR
jgi:hypothetical protein